MITDLFTFTLFITVFVLGVPELSWLVPVVTIVMLKWYIFFGGFSACRKFFGSAAYGSSLVR